MQLINLRKEIIIKTFHSGKILVNHYYMNMFLVDIALKFEVFLGIISPFTMKILSFF